MLEARIALVKVRFKKLCKNYTLRILQIQESNPVKIRAPFNSPYSNKYNRINWTRFDNS